MERDIQEIREAKAAGYRAITSLKEAQNRLKSAGNWGVFDMLGGGMISSILKHSKCDSANEKIEQAGHDLREFQRELKDVYSDFSQDLRVDISSFLSVTDILFDNIFSDWAVQKEIRNAQYRIEAVIDQAEHILKDLERMEREESQI